MGKPYRIYRAPKEIVPVQNRLDFMRRGADAHNAYPDSLALSCDWTAAVQEESVPVYAVPVTRGGPHSFCMVEIEEENTVLEFCLTFREPVRSVAVFPEGALVTCSAEGQSVFCTARRTGVFTLEVNRRINTPITVFLRSASASTDCGEVRRFESGLHEVDFLELESNQTIVLEGGAVLKAVPPKTGEPVMLESDWAEKPNFQDFIFAMGKHDIRIVGNGIVDLSALDWHARRTMCFTECENITVDGPVLVGAAHWTAAFFQCRNITVKNLGLFGYRENSDGIDIVNCERVHVSHCFIRTGDDAVCVKSMLSPPHIGGWDILVEYCQIWNDKVRALSIAGESKSDIGNVTFQHCTVLHSFADWAGEVGALSIALCDSGTVHDILFRDITVCQEAAYPINCILMRDRWSTDDTAGHIHNVRFEDIRIPADAPVQMCGYDDLHLVENVTLKHISIEGKVGCGSILMESNRYVRNISVEP